MTSFGAIKKIASPLPTQGKRSIESQSDGVNPPAFCDGIEGFLKIGALKDSAEKSLSAVVDAEALAEDRQKTSGPRIERSPEIVITR